MLYHKKALPNRQCTSFHATGCHFTGPVALRPRFSSGLPISLLFLNFCKKSGFIILWFSTVYKKNITVLTPENQKRTADTYTRTVLLLSKSTKHWHYCFLLPSLTVCKRKNRCNPCIYWAVAIFLIVTKYGNLFFSFTFFLDCFHSAFRYKLIVRSKAAGFMKIISNGFPFV